MFFLFCSSWYEKNLLNFVTERKKLVSGLTILALPFKLLKPQFIGRILQNKSPYLNFNYCFIGGTLKNIWSFTLYLEAGETELMRYDMCVVSLAIAELGQMSWSSSHTKICTPQTAASLYSAFESWRYFNVVLLNTLSRNKRRKNCEESRWRSLSALGWP